MSKGKRKNRVKNVHKNKYVAELKLDSGGTRRTIKVGGKQRVRGERKKRTVTLGGGSISDSPVISTGFNFGRAPLTRRERRKIRKQKAAGEQSTRRDPFIGQPDDYSAFTRGGSSGFSKTLLRKNTQSSTREVPESASKPVLEPAPEIDYETVFRFEKTDDGYNVYSYSLRTVIKNIEHNKRISPSDRIHIKNRNFYSFDELRRYFPSDSELEQEIAAVQAIIEKGLEAHSMTAGRQESAEKDDGEARENYNLYFDNPTKYSVYAKNVGSLIMQLDCDSLVGQTSIDIYTADNEVYRSFEEARKENKDNKAFLNELSVIEGMIKKKGGEVF